MLTIFSPGRLALAALVALSSLSGSARADAPTVVFDTQGIPATLTPGESHVLNLRYSVSGSDLEDAVISIDLPYGVLPTGAGHDASWVGGCQPDGGSDPANRNLDWECSWTAAAVDVPQGGLSGQIALTLLFPRHTFGHGQALAATARLEASYQEGGNRTSINPLTSSVNTTTEGNIELTWGNYLDIPEYDYAYIRLADGTVGVVAQFQVQIQNYGTTRVDEGATLDLALPDGVVFAGWSTNGFDLELVSDTLPGDGGIVTFGVNRNVGQVYTNPEVDSASGGTYARNINQNSGFWFPVRVVFTCDAVPSSPQDTVELSLSGVASGRSPANATVLTTSSVAPSGQITYFDSSFICGKPVRTLVNRSSSSGQSQFFTISTALHPPTGVVPVEGAYSCTVIPPGLRAFYSYNWIPHGSSSVLASELGFRTWSCRLPAVTTAFDRATFASLYRDTAACDRVDDGAYFDDRGRPNATHIVTEGPTEWGEDDPLGKTVWAPLQGNIQVVVDRCMVDAAPASFLVNNLVSAEVNGVIQSATADMTVTSGVLALPSWSTFNNPTTATRGQTQVISLAPTLAGDSAPLLNPVITVPLPPGVTPVVVENLYPVTNEGCVVAPLTWSVTAGVLRIQAGTANAPWYLDHACYINRCEQGGSFYVKIVWAFSANHPFTNGQRVDFNYKLTGDNMDPNGWQPEGSVHTESLTMQVPGEKRLVLGPTCDAENRTGLVTRFANSGGIPLSNVTVDVPIPRAGDGSGTEVSPALFAAASTLGTVQCSADGQSYSSTCNAATAHVRVQLAALAPYQTGELVLTFANNVAFPIGALVRHRASMTSSELLPIVAPPGPPARWNRCPGTLSVSAWFDADHNDVFDLNESGLGGWVISFIETNPPNGAALEFTIDVTQTGRTTIELPPGEYDITILPADPADAGAEWIYLATVPASLTVNTGLTTTLEIPVDCACDDDDACTIDTCGAGGFCGNTINPEIAGCVAVCGNGIEERQEECDLSDEGTWQGGCYECKCQYGYVPDPDSTQCLAVCGDGIQAGDEECDDGAESDSCDTSCRRKCGNGQVDLGEQCDTGNPTDLVNGCLNCECSFAGWAYDAELGGCVPRCGDHLVMGAESCDDGNDASGDGCSSTCQIEDGWACERPVLTGCLPEEFCGEGRPAWCTISDPENPGQMPTDWCGFLFGGQDSEDFCEAGDLQCENDAPECDGGKDQPDFCYLRGIFCGFCETMGTSTCTELCFPSAEICNGLDEDCDGLVDASLAQPTVSVCGPVDTTIVTHPPALTAETAATFTYQNPVEPTNERFECRLDGGEWYRCNGGQQTLSDLTVGQHVFVVRAIRGDGLADATPAFYGWTIDPTVPDTFITSGPDDPTGSSTATFTFEASVVVEVYYCAMTVGTAQPMEGDWAVCDPRTTFEGVDDGQHTLWVYAVTPAGVPDPTPASWTFTVETDQPETVVTSGPNAHTTATEAVLTYEDPDDPEIELFMCRIDRGEWFPCPGGTTTFQGLTDGTHLFEVYAIDALGVIDETPATWTWTVDNAPPDTFITTGPANPSQTGDGDFTFASNEANVVYYCVVAVAGATPALATYVLCDATHAVEGLENGTWTMWVYAVDQAGNPDPTPATWTWVVDDSAPETIITTGPAAPLTVGSEAVFTYTSPNADGDPDFECRVDGGDWYACNGGTTTVDGGGLTEGEHTIEVRACDRERQICDPTPASWTWTLTSAICPNDEAGPVMSCSGELTVECVGGTAVVDVKALTAAATDNCMPVTVVANVPDRFVLGANSVVFTSEDGTGNTSSCAVPVTVRDTMPPVVACPGDIVLPMSPDICGAVLPASQIPAAQDACWGDAVTYTSNAPSIFPAGVTAVSAAWADGTGNIAKCDFVVTVTAGADAQLACPQEGLVASGGASCGGGDTSDLALVLFALLGLLALARRRQVNG